MQTGTSSTTQLSQTVRTLGHAISGGAAGVFVKFLLFPIDTSSVQFTQHPNQLQVRSSVASGRILTLKDIADDLIHFRNLDDIYKGCLFGMFRAATFHGVYFGFYEALKTHYLSHHVGAAEMPPLVALFRGSLAGILTQLVAIPLAVIETRLMSSEDNSTTYLTKPPRTITAWTIASDIFKNEGILGFWSGFLPSVILVINPAIVFFVYDRLSKFLAKTLGKYGNPNVVAFLTGGISKAIATVICYPLVFIKTLLMAGGGAGSKSTSESNGSSPRSRRIRMANYESKESTEGMNGPVSGEDMMLHSESNSSSGSEGDSEEDETSEQQSKRNSRKVTFSEEVSEAEVDLSVLNDEERALSNGSSSGDESGSMLDINGETFEKAAVIRERSRKLKSKRGNRKGESAGGYGRGGRSMFDIYNDTMKDRGIAGLYRGMSSKILHASLTYAILFSSKENFSKVTFIILTLLLSSKQGGSNKVAQSAQ